MERTSLARSAARVGFTFLVLQTVFSGMAWAVCSCPGGTGTPSDRLETYDHVFLGLKTGGRPCGCGSDLSHETRFVVTESFKGVDVDDEVRVFHDTNSDECGVRFASNTEHLVYVNDGMVDLCDPGGPAFENLAEIDDLRDLTE